MAKAVKKQALGRGLSALLKDPENDIKSIDIDVSNLPNSVYLVRLINDKKVYTKKFIKN